jgi:hypothetical protein
MKCKYNMKYDFLSNEFNSIDSELYQNPIKYNYLNFYIKTMIARTVSSLIYLVSMYF